MISIYVLDFMKLRRAAMTLEFGLSSEMKDIDLVLFFQVIGDYLVDIAFISFKIYMPILLYTWSPAALKD